MKFNEVKLKYIAHLNPSKSEIDLGENKEQVVSFLPMDKIIGPNNLDLSLNKTIGEVYSGYTYFRENDIVLAKVTPCFENGNLAIARGLTNEIGFGTTELHVLRVNEKFYDKEYIYYCLQSEDFISEAVANMYGVGGLKRIPTEFLSEYKFLVPDLDTQIRIRKYLNLKLNEISNLIGNKTKLIKLLDQQRQSIITEAVTKGLNPNVKMKDSGVEWVGEIPEHWTVNKIKRIVEILTCGYASTPTYVAESEGVPFLSAQNVSKSGKLKLEKYNYISRELHDSLTKYKKPRRGDILQVRVGAGIGQTCIVDVDFDFSIYVSLSHIRVKKFIHNKFLTYILGSQKFNEYANMQTLQAGGVGNLNVSDLEKSKIPYPSLEEQIEIANYLDEKCSSIDCLVGNINNQIEKLKEYRQSLIYEAVTGKIDVRDMELD